MPLCHAEAALASSLVAVALLIGTIELLAVFADKLSLTVGLWDFGSNLDLNIVDYVIVGLFVIIWIIALSVRHFGHIEEKWSGGTATTTLHGSDDRTIVATR